MICRNFLQLPDQVRAQRACKSSGSSLFEIIIALGIAGILLVTYLGYCVLIPSKLQVVVANNDIPQLVHTTNAFLETLPKEDLIANTLQVTFAKMSTDGGFSLNTEINALTTPYCCQIIVHERFTDAIDLIIRFYCKNTVFFEYPYHKII